MAHPVYVEQGRPRPSLYARHKLAEAFGSCLSAPNNVILNPSGAEPASLVVLKSLQKGTSETMKAVILAGGLGTRLAEETEVKPKPMVEIGGRPILWHIMKIYFPHGIHDFVVCLGYKGYIIKEYLEKYPLHTSDVTFDMRNQKVTFHRRMTEPWTVTL